MKIAISSDHAGFECKEYVKTLLNTSSFEVVDFGPHSSASVDYPDYVHPLIQKFEAEEYTFAILICGSGNGVAMVANKYPNIRAALCWTEEIAKFARTHNNANVICIPAKFVDRDEVKRMVDVFLDASFEGGRHENRVMKINPTNG